MGLTSKLAEFFNVGTLNPADQAELTRCVATIRQGLQSFIEAGRAFKVIRDRQLYRVSHPTLESFAQAEFGLTARRLGQLIESFDVVESLKLISPSPHEPKTEATVRPLANLPKGDQVEAYLEAVEVAGGEVPTPRQVREAAAKRRPSKKAARVAKPVRLRVPGATVEVTPNKAFTTVEAALRDALKQLGEADRRSEAA